MVKAQLGAAVPFANYVGVQIETVEVGAASASLEQRQETSNHIGTQHAGAMFTLGEAASGAAMAGAFAEQLLGLRPVAAIASIAYKKIAKGTLRAHAKTGDKAEVLREALEKDGKVQFSVHVSIIDEKDTEVGTMDVDWHVSKAR